MKYNEILDWLREHDFEVKHSEFFYPEYIFCQKEQTNVVLKEYKNYIAEEIRSDAVDTRSMLNKLGENVWNTYYLICTNSDQNHIPYSIEKDSVGLRKYVINSFDDIKRIPFLDKTTSLEGLTDNTNIKIHSDQNGNLDKMIDHIISIDGLHRNLNDNEILEILSKFYDVEVKENED